MNRIKKQCVNCKHFEKITQPKMCWLDREKIIKVNYPELSHQQQMALVNDGKSWEQQDSGFGFCKKNDFSHQIECRIPDYMSCKYFKPAHP
jgi:hypothetical protein